MIPVKKQNKPNFQKAQTFRSFRLNNIDSLVQLFVKRFVQQVEQRRTDDTRPKTLHVSVFGSNIKKPQAATIQIQYSTHPLYQYTFHIQEGEQANRIYRATLLEEGMWDQLAQYKISVIEICQSKTEIQPGLHQIIEVEKLEQKQQEQQEDHTTKLTENQVNECYHEIPLNNTSQSEQAMNMIAGKEEEETFSDETMENSQDPPTQEIFKDQKQLNKSASVSLGDLSLAIKDRRDRPTVIISQSKPDNYIFQISSDESPIDFECSSPSSINSVLVKGSLISAIGFIALKQFTKNRKAPYVGVLSGVYYVGKNILNYI